VEHYAHVQDHPLPARALDILATGVLRMLRIAEHGMATEHHLDGSPEHADSSLASLELPPVPAISLPVGERVESGVGHVAANRLQRRIPPAGGTA
jgi:hypothetical protein